MRPVIIIKVGSAANVLPDPRGDFEGFIAEGMALTHDAIRIVDPRRGDPLPDPDEARAFVITGSGAMVTHREPWSVRTAAWLPSVVREEIPVLGICYGHQLLADALGGQVADNPRGREIGTVEVRTTPLAAHDPLFSVLPATLRMQATHLQTVLRLPNGAVHLAMSDGDDHQAFRIGTAAWGVQFHPEFEAWVMHQYLDARREEVTREGIDVEAQIAAVTCLGHGRALLRRFSEIANARLPLRVR